MSLLFRERRVPVIAPLLWRVLRLCQRMVTSGPVLSDEFPLWCSGPWECLGNTRPS